MTFLRVVGKRLFWAAVLLVLVLCLNFFLIRLAPGDPAVTIAGEMGGASPELLASIREQYGLNQSLFNQFVAYFGKVLHGDLGYSYFFNLPVMELIQDRLPATLLLVVTAVCAAVLIGVCLGVQAGRRPNSWTSHLVTIVALIGFSAPAFWTGHDAAHPVRIVDPHPARVGHDDHRRGLHGVRLCPRRGPSPHPAGGDAGDPLHRPVQPHGSAPP